MSAHRWGSLLAGMSWLVLTGAAGWAIAQPAAQQAGATTGGLPIAAPPPPAVPVKVQVPNPAHQTKPVELRVISAEVLDKLLKQQDASAQWYVGIFLLVITAFTTVLTILVGWIHKRSEDKREKEFERDREALQEQFKHWSENADFERHRHASEQAFDEFKKRTEEKLNQQFTTLAKTTKRQLATEVGGQVKTLFKDRYEEQIAQVTKALTQEVLMTTPDARDNLVSILRRTVNELSSIVTRLPHAGAATELHQFLVNAIEDWHALGQLYSPDREQLETGLLAIQARPIPEAAGRLRRLQQRYSSDLDLLPGIVTAIEKVEQQQAAPSDQA